MELLIGLLISFTAGVLSFLTPCVLPLVPSYLTFMGGTTVQELNSSVYNRKRLFFRALFFVIGFTIAFSLAGLFIWGAFSVVGGLSQTINQIVNITAGIIIILLGLNIIFDFFNILNREKRAQMSKRPENLFGALLLGLSFGVGWSPCIGPLLAGIIGLSGTSGTLVEGIAKLLMYSIGLGIPFLILSIAFVPVSKKLSQIKKYFPVLKIISGVLLILIGLLIFFGQFLVINIALTEFSLLLRSLHQDFSLLLYFFFTILYGGIAFLAGFSWIRKRFFSETPKTAVVMILIFIFFLVLFILQVFGIIQTELLIADWLLIQNIDPVSLH